MEMRHVKITKKNGDEIEGYVYLDDGETIGVQTMPQRVETPLADVQDIETMSPEYVEPITELDEDGNPIDPSAPADEQPAEES